MFHRLLLTLPLLSLTLLALASPLDSRAPVSIESLLAGTLSGTAKLIKDILDENVSGMSDELSAKPSLTSLCKTRLLLHMYLNQVSGYNVSTELTKLFIDANGQCNDNARGAVRLGFHDAGAWNKAATNGGADGSFLMDFGKETRTENKGLQNIRTVLRSVQAKYEVGYADLAQYAHNHATVSCPKGPHIRTFVGRKDATGPAPTGLLPNANDSPEDLIKLFADKGFMSDDLVALVGAHISGTQTKFDTSAVQVGKAFDTTPGVWDVEFYNDTLQDPQNSNIFVLPSDKKLSTYKDMKDDFKSYVGNQNNWNRDYAKAWMRMSLNGVTNLGSLKDCTRTLPVAQPNGR